MNGDRSLRVSWSSRTRRRPAGFSVQNASRAALGPVGVQVVVIELPRSDPETPVPCQRDALLSLEALHTKLNIEESSLLRGTGERLSLSATTSSTFPVD